MEVRINIECNTIGELGGHLAMLSKQLKKLAKEEKLDPFKDELEGHHGDTLYDDDCYGTHVVSIHDDGTMKEAQQLMVKLIDTEKYGESSDAERLWLLVFGQQMKLK